MPTYDYECDACEHKFEHFQGINDPVLTKCPECKKKKLRRLIGAGGAVVFKGSGFYQTDYRSESYKQKAAADKPSDSGSSGGESKGETKSESKPAESKPAAKSESKKKAE
jgi:putative FmdB family regulatory protein